MKIANWFLGLPKKTKIITAIITSAVIVSIGVGVTLNATKHIHSYDELVTAPTCTEQGFTTYTCSCGDSYVENYVNALGHTEVVDVAVAPTCVKKGLTEGKHCSVCNEVIIAQQTVSATGHSFTNEIASNQYLKSYATCENGAIYYKSCSCGKKGSDTFEYGEKLEHSYDQNIVTSKYLKTEATCINVAVYYKSCKCGAKGSETFEYGSTLPHDFGTYSKTQNATCTENAKETAYCQNKDCNESVVRDIEGTALGHGDINTSNVCSVCNKEVAYTKGMVYVAITGGYQLIDMGATTDTDIIIPKYYNGAPVISIGDEVFMNKSTLNSIQLPNSITSIGNKAFYGCKKLKDINLPNGLKTLGDNVFSYCNSLTEIIIPNSVTEIPSLTFLGCNALEKMTVPYIGVSATRQAFGVFAEIFGTYTTTNINTSVPEGLTFMYLEVVFGSSMRMYYHYSAIPNSLKTVIVTDGATSVGDNAFHGCKYIENISLPDSITCIGDDAFHSCESLKNFTIPKNVTSIGDNAFDSCIKLTSIVIPEKVTSIGANAFSCDGSLSSGMAITSIRFENTSGWKVGGNVIDVSNPSTNAILFKKTYVSSSWSRS